VNDDVTESFRPTILCVDDEPGILRALVRIFRAEPVRILTAPSGPEGLAVLRQEPVDLILTDYRMPEMTGVQFLEQACEIRPEAFRVLLTGYAESGAVAEAINRGHIYKVLYKPWNDEDLKLTVRSALAHYAQNQQNRALQKELAAQNVQLQALAVQLGAKLEVKASDLDVCAGTLFTAQRLLDLLPCAVLGLDDSEQIVFANRTAEDWFGGKDLPLVGTWAEERLPPAIFAPVSAVLKSREDAHSIAHIETSLNDDRVVQVSCRIIAAADSEGGTVPVGALLYAAEVNARVPATSTSAGGQPLPCAT
jgi:two-component system NtrC family sensor kinase